VIDQPLEEYIATGRLDLLQLEIDSSKEAIGAGHGSGASTIGEPMNSRAATERPVR
jgi:hypothetical protein